MTTGSKKNTGREKLLIQVLRKIPIFLGLSPSQVKRVLALCTHRQYEPGEVVCQSNTPSDEMYILLSGEVCIVTLEGMKVAAILSVTTVGEMGVITGHPRSATVEVTRPSAIIDILASKLSNDNVRIRDYQMEKDRADGRISVLERPLDLQQRRTKIAVATAAESTQRDASEIELQIND